MIHKIWLQQPIAFARVGTSKTPLSAFRWTQQDLRPRGSGRTTIAPAPSFAVDPQTGIPTSCDDAQFTLFRDEGGIRPVCPFFELHGEWDAAGGRESGPLTPAILDANGHAPAKLTWRIHHANHKAYSLTHQDGDRIEAELAIRGDDHVRQCLLGRSPPDAPNPLVPPNASIKMGELQVVRPTPEHPTIRMRFYPPPGHAYAPTDLAERLTGHTGLVDRLIALFKVNARWQEFALPDDRRFLRADAAWPQYKLLTYGQLIAAVPRVVLHLRSFIALVRRVQFSELARFLLGPLGDAGKLPPGLFAARVGNGAILSSLGMIDDLGDGIISCELDGVGVARARIVVCPPHFAPDRRPPVSIADDLTDRTRRAEVRSPEWAGAANWALAEAEIDDLLDRAYETAGLSNLDAWNEELRAENESDVIYRGDTQPPPDAGKLLWADRSKETVLDLPLTELGRWRHRRNAADPFFEQLVRDRPELIERSIRDQDDALSLYYDRRMPALMRGSDRRPLHLTRRQWGAFRRWVAALRERPGEKIR